MPNVIVQESTKNFRVISSMKDSKKITISINKPMQCKVISTKAFDAHSLRGRYIASTVPGDKYVLAYDLSDHTWKAQSLSIVGSHYHYKYEVTVTEEIAAEQSVTFPEGYSYTVSNDSLDVYLNGVMLNSEDYEKTSTTVVTFTEQVITKQDVLIFKWFK